MDWEAFIALLSRLRAGGGGASNLGGMTFGEAPSGGPFANPVQAPWALPASSAGGGFGGPAGNPNLERYMALGKLFGVDLLPKERPQPIFGMDPSRFALLAGTAANAISPNSVGGRLGAGAAGLASNEINQDRETRKQLLSGLLQRGPAPQYQEGLQFDAQGNPVYGERIKGTGTLGYSRPLTPHEKATLVDAPPVTPQYEAGLQYDAQGNPVYGERAKGTGTVGFTRPLAPAERAKLYDAPIVPPVPPVFPHPVEPDRTLYGPLVKDASGNYSTSISPIGSTPPKPPEGKVIEGTYVPGGVLQGLKTPLTVPYNRPVVAGPGATVLNPPGGGPAVRIPAAEPTPSKESFIHAQQVKLFEDRFRRLVVEGGTPGVPRLRGLLGNLLGSTAGQTPQEAARGVIETLPAGLKAPAEQALENVFFRDAQPPSPSKGTHRLSGQQTERADGTYRLPDGSRVTVRGGVIQ